MEPSMSAPNLDPNSFDAAFAVLENNAAKLRSGNQMQIDDLLPIVEQSTAAYKICKERLERVRAALQQHLSNGLDGDVAGAADGEPGV